MIRKLNDYQKLVPLFFAVLVSPDLALALFILLVLAVCVEAYMTTYRVPDRRRTWRQVEGDPISRRIGLIRAAFIVIIGGGFATWVLGTINPVTPLELISWYFLLGGVILLIFERSILAGWNYYVSRHQKWRYRNGRWYRRWEK